jgi:16S rRNA (cytidine1402-2'-O)-methyltransferase
MAILLSEENPLYMSPALYVVATPLGNRKDISMRALEVLRAANTIAAEDTRHSQRLLEAHGISAHLLALHEHNEQEGATRIIEMLGAGQHVALITDAGTPAISDPGARLVARVQEAGFPVLPIPGPCAAITALSASGLTAPHFHFVGFLPTKTSARKSALETLRGIEESILVFYEAPHRILECVEDLQAGFEPEREIVFARELTKLFEQIARMPLAQAMDWLKEDPNRQRGEFVLLIGPAPKASEISAEAQKILALLLEELPLKKAARLASEITGVPKNTLYDLGLGMKDDA